VKKTKQTNKNNNNKNQRTTTKLRKQSFSAKKRCPSLKNFLEERDVEDATALHMSCSKGYTGVTELLLRHGVDCEAGKGVNLSTPLHLATTHGHEEVIRLLISSGAVIDCWDGHLKTPLHQ